jgi:hypothetical protein
MANAAFHKLQAEEMIKKLNGLNLSYDERMQRDFVVTLAHSLLANVTEEEDV